LTKVAIGLFAVINLGIVDSLGQRYVDYGDRCRAAHYHGENLQNMSRRVARQDRDKVMIHGVQLPDLFETRWPLRKPIASLTTSWQKMPNALFADFGNQRIGGVKAALVKPHGGQYIGGHVAAIISCRSDAFF